MQRINQTSMVSCLSVQQRRSEEAKKEREDDKKVIAAVQNRRKRKFRPGTVALREIKKYQKSVKLVIAKAPFQRLIKEIVYFHGAGSDRPQFKMTTGALEVLQEAAEAHLTSIFIDSYVCALHTGRITLMQKDMILARRLRGERSEEHYPQSARDKAGVLMEYENNRAMTNAECALKMEAFKNVSATQALQLNHKKTDKQNAKQFLTKRYRFTSPERIIQDGLFKYAKDNE